MIKNIEQLKIKLLSIKDKFIWQYEGNSLRLIYKHKDMGSNDSYVFCPITAIRYEKTRDYFPDHRVYYAAQNLVTRRMVETITGAADNYQMVSKYRKELREWMIREFLN